MTQLKKIIRSKYYAIALIDGQPGTGNNLLEAGHEPPLIVIDHHPLRKMSLKSPFHDIRPHYGATSTIITEYIIAAGLTPTRSVANALLYGIKTDTNSLSRGTSHADFEAFNYLAPLTNPRVLGWIENPMLSQEDFVDYHRGLGRTTLYRDVAISDLGKVHNVDIIPKLADLLLRLEGVTWSLCMGRTNNMLVLSLRSSSRKYRAGRVIRRLLGKLGSAGGHTVMAAGQVQLDTLDKSEKEKLSQRLIQKFLQIMDRHGCQPKPLVNEEPS